MKPITSTIASVITACAILFGALLPAAAQAAPIIDPSAETALEIHKFEQPETVGAVATGLPQDTTGLTPVAGAEFAATLVPGVDLATNAGQRRAAELTPAEAADLIVSASPAEPAATDSTDDGGNATLAPLAVGLYYVEETSTPAGVVASAPFLVALPLTDPATKRDHLPTVHVYPKGVAFDTEDADSGTDADGGADSGGEADSGAGAGRGVDEPEPGGLAATGSRIPGLMIFAAALLSAALFFLRRRARPQQPTA